MDNLTADVLAFVVRHAGPVRPDEVAEHLGAETLPVNYALCRLANYGHIARVRRGLYSGDPQLRRQALLDRAERLTPA